MRPDRIIVGECRSAEALDMIQAMMTGQDKVPDLHTNCDRDEVLERGAPGTGRSKESLGEPRPASA